MIPTFIEKQLIRAEQSLNDLIENCICGYQSSIKHWLEVDD